MVFLFWGVGTMWNRVVLTKFVGNLLSPVLGHRCANYVSSHFTPKTRQHALKQVSITVHIYTV